MEVANMRGPGFGILLLLLAAALITMLTSCAHKRVMKNCKPLPENYFQCEEP